MDYKDKDSKLQTLLISESNYSCQLLEESFIKMKNEKNKEIYKLDEKENDIYEKQEQLSKKMLELISNNQKQFNHKYKLIQKEEDLYHKEYNNFNLKLMNLLNQYNDNRNNMCINPFYEIFDNKWVFPQKEPINSSIKSFKSKCNIKSCEKRIIKNKANNNILNSKKELKNKYTRSNSKTFRKSINSLNTFNTVGINSKNNNKIFVKTKRKSNLEFNNFDKKKEKIKKSTTTRTTTRFDNNSLFEFDDNINDMKYYSIKDSKKDLEDKIIIKPDYSKYLTRDNFYPKSYRIESNRERVRLSNDEFFYETKTSFRDKRMKKDLYDKAFKKCNYHSNM